MRSALLVLVGCGRIAFEPRDDSGVTTDAPCAFGPFGAPVHQPALGSTSVDWGPAFSPDGLELYFTSNRPGGMGVDDIYRASRATRTDPFGNVVNVTELNSTATESSPMFADDGLTLYFTSIRTPVPELYRATRPALDAAFDVPQRVPELVGVTILGGALSADGRELYYDYPVMQRRLHDGTMFGAAMTVPELGDPAGYGSLTRDGLTMFLLAQVASPGMGEIHVTTRAATDQPWGPVTGVAPLAGHGDDPDISRDGRELVFTSVRVGGEHELFIATRECM